MTPYLSFLSFIYITQSSMWGFIWLSVCWDLDTHKLVEPTSGCLRDVSIHWWVEIWIDCWQMRKQVPGESASLSWPLSVAAPLGSFLGTVLWASLSQTPPTLDRTLWNHKQAKQTFLPGKFFFYKKCYITVAVELVNTNLGSGQMVQRVTTLAVTPNYWVGSSGPTW